MTDMIATETSQDLLPVQSITTKAARNLATTTKSTPHMAEITSRWLLRMLPWVQVAGGVYRVNRKKSERQTRLVSGHTGQALLPSGFADYDLMPREYELSVTQTILRIPVSVVDLFNDPIDQLEQQLHLTVQAIRERQEYELLHNGDFGLLHHIVPDQHLSTNGESITPASLDELLCLRRDTAFFLAHPRAIAAFGRVCTDCGIYPCSVLLGDTRVPSWRDVPLLPCTKLPVDEHGETSILALRIGEDNQGVVGLHQTGIADEYEPSLSVRFMGITDHALLSYLISAYYSVAVSTADAIGRLDANIGESTTTTAEMAANG